MTTGAVEKMRRMRAGVVDVGSNTVTLLVASLDDEGRLEPFAAQRVQVGLASDIERIGGVGPERMALAARRVANLVRRGWRAGAVSIEVLLASPGRQAANAAELVDVLSDAAAGAPVRVLSREEEACLAWDGALAGRTGLHEPVAVVDVGGGSTQLTVGTLDGGPAWIRSVDLGALRLTERALSDDAPGKQALRTARAAAREAFDGLVAPLPATAFAVGGSARGLKKLTGERTLGPDELREALRLLRKDGARAATAGLGLDPWRVRTLAAGAVILEQVVERLGVPLEVVRGGVRDGAVLALLAEEAVATG
jgi:exopolyphosphatase/guanosine-5'-triphosphate,3'-diphosphate pyrophosphatase